MGQPKHNPTAIAAKNGELPPKEQPRLSKRQMDTLMRKRIEDATGVTELRKYLFLKGGTYEKVHSRLNRDDCYHFVWMF